MSSAVLSWDEFLELEGVTPVDTDKTLEQSETIGLKDSAHFDDVLSSCFTEGLFREHAASDSEESLSNASLSSCPKSNIHDYDFRESSESSFSFASDFDVSVSKYEEPGFELGLEFGFMLPVVHQTGFQSAPIVDSRVREQKFDAHKGGRSPKPANGSAKIGRPRGSKDKKPRKKIVKPPVSPKVQVRRASTKFKLINVNLIFSLFQVTKRVCS